MLLCASTSLWAQCGTSVTKQDERCRLEQQAARGDAAAQQRLGWRYAVGRGVPQDYEKAVHFARLAVEQGNVQAASDLGFYYFNGHGIGKDPAQAERWWRYAAARGEKLALSSLAYQFADQASAQPSEATRRYAEIAAFQFWLEACRTGDPGACKKSAKALQSGRGVPANTALAAAFSRLVMAPQDLYRQTLSWLRRAQPQSFDLSTIPAGTCRQLEWQRTVSKLLPVFACRRTPAQIASLAQAENTATFTPEQARAYARQASDSERASEYLAMQPFIADRAGRGLHDEWLIVSALEPRFGCVMKADFDGPEQAFYNPCHGDRWNRQGIPTAHKTNIAQDTQPLLVPPYRLSGQQLTLGVLPDGAAVEYRDFSPDIASLNSLPVKRLALAARWQKLDLLRELLETSDHQALEDSARRAEVLIQAASSQYLPAVLLLLEHGFDPTEETRFGGSALQVAKILDHSVMLALLKGYTPDD